MKQAEFRVRPVIRHSVTLYEPAWESPIGKVGSSGGSSIVGEFANEEQAEKVRLALELQHAPRQYICVKRSFDLETPVQHADTQEEADAFVKERFEAGEEWRIFSRIVTDPVLKAHIMMRL